MKQTIYVVFILATSLLWACTQSETAPSTSSAMSAQERLVSMEQAIENLERYSYTAEFRVATPNGPSTGNVDVQIEKPAQFRALVTSEQVDLNGLLAVANGEKGWAYNPNNHIVLVAEKSDYQAQLPNQPEVREVLEYTEEVLKQGVGQAKATDGGLETINGQETHKLWLDFSGIAELDDEALEAIVWVNTTTLLPQRLQITLEEDGFQLSGFIQLVGDVNTAPTFDESTFTFDMPENADVVDMTEITIPETIDLD